MKEYYISIDLDEVITAESEEEALRKANEAIKEKCYSLYINDSEEIKNDE